MSQNINQSYNNIFNNIDSYRHSLIEYLKKENLFYENEKINLSVNEKEISYYRWLHPYQTAWELDWIFNVNKLNSISKIIKKDSVVLDLGAHTGNYSVGYSLFAKKVISFEPNPVTFSVLNKNVTLNPNIIAYNVGCAEEDKQMEFYYSDPGFNNGGNDMGSLKEYHPHPIDVYCINIDKFLKELHPEDYNNISFIKIDCEGYDTKILPTLKNIIEKNKPIIETELFEGFSVEEKQELIEVINSLGYDCYNFSAVSEDIDFIDLTKDKITKKNVGDIENKGGHYNLICFPREEL